MMHILAFAHAEKRKADLGDIKASTGSWKCHARTRLFILKSFTCGKGSLLRRSSDKTETQRDRETWNETEIEAVSHSVTIGHFVFRIRVNKRSIYMSQCGNIANTISNSVTYLHYVVYVYMYLLFFQWRRPGDMSQCRVNSNYERIISCAGCQ